MSLSIETLKEALKSIETAPSIVDSVEVVQRFELETDNNWSLVTEACKKLADALRTASIRTPLGDAGLIESLSVLLKRASGQEPDFQIQALRVLGNLCFDHENNRKRVKEAGIVSVVSPYLPSGNTDLIRTTCGFYLNGSMDFAPIQNEIAESGAAKELIDLISPNTTDETTVTMAIKVIDNLAAEDAPRKIISTSQTVRAYIRMIQHLYESEEYMDDLDNLENLADTLLQVIMDDDNLQNEIIDMGALDFLLSFLEGSDVQMQDKEDKDKLEEIRKTINKITVYATSTDSKMNELYDNTQLLKRFLNMAESNSEVVHQCAVYILGNLARSDEHCIELVEKYNLSKSLLNLYQTTENAAFQYAILGCLKHLCLPVRNKDIIGNENCIQILSPVLDESKDMLKRNQFLTIGIIKLLCAGNYTNAKRVVQSNDVLQLITSFLKRVDDVAAKSEATRILANLVKTIWVQPDSNDLRAKVMSLHITEPIIELVRTSTFAILKNDGIMALTLIFSDTNSPSVLEKALSLVTADPPAPIISQDNEEEEQKQEKRSFLQVLTDDICSEQSELAVQIRCNACVLLCKVVEAAKLGNQQGTIGAVRSVALERLTSGKYNSELSTYTDTLARALRQA